jgi:hypothetical protein
MRKGNSPGENAEAIIESVSCLAADTNRDSNGQNRNQQTAYASSKKDAARFPALRHGQLIRLVKQRLWQQARARVLPDDDAGREYLFLILVAASLYQRAKWRMGQDWCDLAPWLPEAEAHELIHRILAMPRAERRALMEPDELGRQLRFTLAEHHSIGGVTMIRPDVSPAELEQYRKAKRKQSNRARQERRRRRKGQQSRQRYIATSASRLKPWLQEGFNCRRTWERHKAKQRVAS